MTQSDVLFPPVRPEDGSIRQAAARPGAKTDVGFIKDVKALMRRAGMPMAHRITNHSFRGGGATDWSCAGMAAEFIMRQGGWTSMCFLIYIRPSGEHAWRTASALIKAAASLRRGRQYT